MIDEKGFRAGVAIIIVNKQNKVFWAKRINQNAWQFPQGGMLEKENPNETMRRELYEETGLRKEHIEVIACSHSWIRYRLPKRMIRYYSRPLCIGQKQKWFLLRLIGDEGNVQFDFTDSPEFDGYRWVSYWFPLRQVISFKRAAYRKALQEFAPILFPNHNKSSIKNE